ncbi:hypothetical protein BDN67DRAFT_976657, partial [Paxillus ammoniavirescens]
SLARNLRREIHAYVVGSRLVLSAFTFHEQLVLEHNGANVSVLIILICALAARFSAG